MHDPFIHKAIELAGPSDFQERPSERDWERAEAGFGFKIPAGHKEFVSYFGSGRFGDDLYLYNPAATGRLQFSRGRLESFKQEMSAFLEEMDCKLYPDRGGLVVVASTTSRVHFFIMTKVPATSESIMLDFDLYSREDLHMTLPEFVCRLYCRELGWAKELRTLIWTDPAAPFFTRFTTP